MVRVALFVYPVGAMFPQDALDQHAQVRSQFSHSVHPMVTLLRMVLTSFRAMVRSVSSPNTCTALSLVPSEAFFNRFLNSYSSPFQSRNRSRFPILGI